jgi:UTP--glucose-1-phosphate uridylyltransferase
LKVRKAVIPAAGLGTRFLPATKAMPKEMITVVDKPPIQYAVEEAVRAGIDDILIVTSRGKESLADHFDRSFELESVLEARGKGAELQLVRSLSDLATVHFIRQAEALGLGLATSMAREHVGDEPFAMILPDEIVPEPVGDEVSLLGRMIEVYDEFQVGVIAVTEVPKEDVGAYGVIDPEFVRDDLAKMLNFIEKPPPGEAPSNLAARGRYVFAPGIFDAIDRTKPGAGGEIQITDAIKIRADEEGAYALVYSGPIFDVGKKLDFLRASIELALRRPDLARPMREFIRSVADREA